MLDLGDNLRQFSSSHPAAGVMLCLVDVVKDVSGFTGPVGLNEPSWRLGQKQKRYQEAQTEQGCNDVVEAPLVRFGNEVEAKSSAGG